MLAERVYRGGVYIQNLPSANTQVRVFDIYSCISKHTVEWCRLCELVPRDGRDMLDRTAAS